MYKGKVYEFKCLLLPKTKKHETSKKMENGNRNLDGDLSSNNINIFSFWKSTYYHKSIALAHIMHHRDCCANGSICCIAIGSKNV
jgi:hypothetical protein